MTDRPRGGRQVTCPDCGGPVRPDRERLCPRCGYPLMFLRSEPEPDAPVVTRAPGERDDATAVLSPRVDPAPPWAASTPPTGLDAPPRPGEVACPRCGERNVADRVRCQRCGTQLATPREPAAPAPLPPPVPAPRRRGVPVGLALAVAAVLALAVAAVVVWLRYADGRAAGDGVGPTAGVVAVDARRVRLTASSVVPNRPQFDPANLLDGDPATTWQSNADRLRTNVGVRLTFRFDRAVRLARITVVNGDGRTPVDYRNNERVAGLAVGTDGGTVDWALPDTHDPQALDVGGVQTETVTLVVRSVYPGSRFRDLAIAEVSFAALS